MGKLSPKKPRVAVITATRNRKEYLHRCIESVAAQTYRNIEHIIIDDNSTDGTWDFLQRMKGRYRIIPLQNQKSGRGGARCRNFGIHRTQAELIAYLDDDDIFYTNHISTLAEHFMGHETCQFAYCAAHKTSDGEFITGMWSTNVWDEDIRAVNLFPICAVMHTKKAWSSVGGMDETLGVYEDWDLWQRMVHCGYIPCFINQTTSLVDGSNNSSIHHVESSKRKQEVGKIIKTKIGSTDVYYRSYLGRCALIKGCIVPKKAKAPTHRDTLKKIDKTSVDLKVAPFWKVIRPSK